MLERLTSVPDGVIALRAAGTVTAQDYEQVIEPAFEEARLQDRRLRILLHLGPDYEGFTAGAVAAKTGVVFRQHSALRQVDGYALVSDIGWVAEVVHLAAFLSPFPIRVFGNDAFDDALAWLQSLPEGPGVSHYMMPATGVLVVDVNQPLRAQDFDAVAATADSWLATHPELPGIVIHARSFPGWENVTSMLHHIRFVRDHHRQVQRVAVAADGWSAEIVPRIAEHFVEASVRAFGFDEFETAVRWATHGAVSDDGRVGAEQPQATGTPVSGS